MPTLAIDPGDTTGIAIIGRSGGLIWHGQMRHSEFIEFLAGAPLPTATARRAMEAIDRVVVEDFKLLPGKARAVSQKASRDVTAARGIGAVQLYAAVNDIELIYRDPSHWRVGLMLAGVEQSKWPKTHKNGHSMCAYGAGMHALVEIGVVDSRMGTL